MARASPLRVCTRHDGRAVSGAAREQSRKRMRLTGRDWTLFFVCVALWGSAYALVRVGLMNDAAPWQIVAGRLWAATLFLHAILFVRRRRGLEPPRTPRSRRKLLAMGLLGAALPFWLYSWAQLSAPSGLVGLYAAVTPLMVAFLAPFFAKSERLDAARVFGLALGFAGVAVLMGPSAFGGERDATLAAQAAAFLGAACYAVNALAARAGADIPPLEAAAGWTFFGAVFATPFGVGETLAGAHPNAVAYLAIAALALGPTGLAAIAYFALVRSAGPVFTVQTNYLMPIWALGLGAVAFGETIGINAIAAFALIALGLFVAQEGWRLWRPAAPPSLG